MSNQRLSAQASSHHTTADDRPDLIVTDSTPVKAKASSTAPNEYTETKADLAKTNRRLQLATEMDGHSFEVDIEVFMKDLVPGSDPTPTDLACFDEFVKKELDTSREVEMYPHIVSSYSGYVMSE